MPDNFSNTRIKKLSPLLINQLAAGEVVTRPAAVVKELLENAIDAGATTIAVHIAQGGMGMIEVVDNGAGIHPDDMVMAITRHATSKVADVANLHGIMTLGFRGEALAATAAVSRLTLTSSHDHSGIGRQLQVAGILDDTPKLLPVVHNRGTTITVRDLYFNVPARRGNLKSIATEFGHIETIVREVALARADITLTLFHDNKKRLSLSASASSNNNRLSLSRLEQAIGTSLMESAIEVAVDLSSLIEHAKEYHRTASSHAGISGWLWPMRDQKRTLPKLIYVNGRLVKEALISNQLRQLAQEAQLAGIGYALYFDLPTEWLNINVHPSKQRIKISPLNNIMAHLSHALRTKLKMVSAIEMRGQKEKEVPSRHISTSKSFDSSKISSSNELALNRQVQSPKQSYQLPLKRPVNKQLSAYSAECHIDEPLDQKVNTSSTVSVENTTFLGDSFAEKTGLPHCLEVITRLNDSILEPSLIKHSDRKALPWLLFYHQGQYLLISANDWWSKLAWLFESNVFKNDGVCQNEETLCSASAINQQLTTASAQMSMQDLTVFTTDVEALLTENAMAIIDNHQLVTWMLSSEL
ncbi:DNA mismatch repair endonuclease MutL [Psychrobacter aquaticus]|uniref:DNA mismatch repair protein MutL n=1 Tax=Psychrobacter aquaticus CMS 56 TaxID=1354303 RepID=U4T380_9GAMM|nr:DNA mismatch repair endonuclease MutL [Psychrobacter aquaticus]ERL54466.1 DNA mismatch repair protein MutL [Psychrobacter aquaticus CMS 56]